MTSFPERKKIVMQSHAVSSHADMCNSSPPQSAPMPFPSDTAESALPSPPRPAFYVSCHGFPCIAVPP